MSSDSAKGTFCEVFEMLCFKPHSDPSMFLFGQ
jgi:hypothetical protein